MKRYKQLKITLNILVLFILFQSSAQNLVPNPSFEIGPDSSSAGWVYWLNSGCNPEGNVNGADDWIPYNGSPDRLVEGTVFQCNWDADTAQHGNAWIGLGNHEAIKANLISPLIKDSLYQLSLYIKHESFQNLSTDPHRIVIMFNNGLDSLVTPYSFYGGNWMRFDTIFTANESATQIILYGLDTFGQFGPQTKVDSMNLIKIANPKTSITEPTLVRIIDPRGRETEDKPNTVLIYIYSDGTIKRVFRVE